jgi:hypothetical protein
MRIVAASDTHGQHLGLEVPDGDVFVHAGDLTIGGDLAAVTAFGHWVRTLPHCNKIVIAGNHDWLFEPRVHVFGHIHEGSGVFVDDGITYINASICDRYYDLANPVRVIDL